MKRIRVLVISQMFPNHADPTDGIFIYNQLKHLRNANCSIRVITPIPHSPFFLWMRPRWREYAMIAQKEDMGGILVHHPRYIRLPGKWFHGISCYTRYYGISALINSMMKDFQPHVLQAYTATPSGYVGLLIKKRHNIPLACSCRGGDINTSPAYNKQTFRLTKSVLSQADQVTTVSAALKIAAETIARPRKDIKVIYNGCNTEAFTTNKEARMRIRQKIGISLEQKVIMFIGHLYRAKGVLELAHAFVKLHSKHPDSWLVFVGKGPAFNTITEIATSNSLLARFFFAGQMKHEEIPDWLNAADIFVLPTYAEGLPNVVLEAMSCRLPIVATKVGGIPEVVADGNSGILIEPMNINQLVTAIDQLLSSNYLRENMGMRGRKIVKEKFSWRGSSSALRAVYEELIQ